MNELKAMAILEAVRSGGRLQQRLQLVRDGRVVQLDTLGELGLEDGLLEDYCLAFACDAVEL